MRSSLESIVDFQLLCPQYGDIMNVTPSHTGDTDGINPAKASRERERQMPVLSMPVFHPFEQTQKQHICITGPIQFSVCLLYR